MPFEIVRNDITKLALEYDCKSIAFPMIATNNYGFPKDKALQIAVAAFSEFLLEHEMLIYLVVFDRSAYKLSEKLFHSIASYIDDHNVDLWEEATYKDFSDRFEIVAEKLPAVDVVRKATQNKIGRFTKQEIRELCPALSLSSVEGALRKLVASGELKREGTGKNTCYYRLH